MENKKTPEIRFTGFTMEWEEHKLEEILKVNSGRDYKHLKKGNIPVYGTGGFMLSVNDSLSDKDAIGIGRKGTIDKPQLLKAPFWTVDTLFYMTTKKKNNLLFCFSLINTIDLKKYDESTGVPSLSKSSIDKIIISKPKLEEQSKIGNFFKQLDDIIVLQQQEIDTLKQIKQGFLQKMFPKEGKSVPEIRFPGFIRDWKQRKLEEVADIIGGGTPSTGKGEYWDGDIDWYSPVELKEKVYVDNSQKKITKLGLQKSSAKILPVGTVLFTSRAGIGNTAILAKESATNQGFQSIVPHKNELGSYFIYSRTHELKRYGETNGAGSTFVEVSGKQMSKMPMMIPTIEEQNQIGNFFRKIDQTITLHQQELETLKQTKKAFLQKMFV
ncbi:restriction endonuclease subunit S [Virgibacillus sp. C22-A2]|uniref:Restriction endonuclease subunit S n=1 Tax=Virgibacillus tibetensis TaxID=3042313 RepID=A0ABU6KIZ3_9BACI|nr:restriction endonuclease subunit S [Virgibacillus sp. C22-A2]